MTLCFVISLICGESCSRVFRDFGINLTSMGRPLARDWGRPSHWDAALLLALVDKLRPRRAIEIGGGWLGALYGDRAKANVTPDGKVWEVRLREPAASRVL